ncbi:hypothetical protein IT970_05625 [Pseudoalteromonas sp. A41-2]|jgi:uncharacterized membrane protein YhaH (DUF805 family)|uniref:hypothetical protein n=1 Tax=unclassified Pseudoalteromonas TaxID=194690 RepID=UPI00094F8F19|nr:MULTISPECIES: hypothetical protein [unclassified Pseudoalteromonas]QMW15544.1 hypothetical protein H3302_05465 [Pseudoalteromonas sp. MT33b]QPL43926.1 hypothetical protein IT970_05625 [Pseudoalteromonas sp. A41-2]
MSTKFWILRAIRVFTLVAILLFMVEILKGHDTQSALSFALLWSFIATAIFIATRLYHSSKGRHCALCNDTPDDKKAN